MGGGQGRKGYSSEGPFQRSKPSSDRMPMGRGGGLSSQQLNRLTWRLFALRIVCLSFSVDALRAFRCEILLRFTIFMIFTAHVSNYAVSVTVLPLKT